MQSAIIIAISNAAANALDLPSNYRTLFTPVFRRRVQLDPGNRFGENEKSLALGQGL